MSVQWWYWCQICPLALIPFQYQQHCGSGCWQLPFRRRRRPGIRFRWAVGNKNRVDRAATDRGSGWLGGGDVDRAQSQHVVLIGGEGPVLVAPVREFRAPALRYRRARSWAWVRQPVYCAQVLLTGDGLDSSDHGTGSASSGAGRIWLRQKRNGASVLRGQGNKKCLPDGHAAISQWRRSAAVSYVGGSHASRPQNLSSGIVTSHFADMTLGRLWPPWRLGLIGVCEHTQESAHIPGFRDAEIRIQAHRDTGVFALLIDVAEISVRASQPIVGVCSFG